MKKTKDSEYAYAYGVVSSMAGKLAEDKTYEELVRFRSVEEVLAFMEGTDYEQEIKKVVGKTIDIKEVENALKRHFVRVYGQIVSSIPANDRAEFDRIMLESFRAENLKVVMRGIHAGIEPAKIMERLETETDKGLMEELSQSKDMEEFAKKLEGTGYGGVIMERLENYKETKSLLPIENAIDRHLVGTWGDISLAEIKKFADIRTDIINIRTILRCKTSGIPPQSYVIKGGTLEGMLGDLMKGDVKDVLSVLDKTPYGNAAREAMQEFEKTNSIVTMEGKMEREVMKYLKENAMLRPLGVASIMLFINSKRREVNNMKTIVVCKHYGIPPEEIKEILV